jgi:hypothetical protein
VKHPIKCGFQNQNQNSGQFSDSRLAEAKFIEEGFVLSLRQSCFGAPVGGTMSRLPFELKFLHRLKSATFLTLLNGIELVGLKFLHRLE